VNPIPLPWPEVFSSLQQGVVDGLDLPYNGMWMAKTYEALKYVTIAGWVYSGIFFTMNKKFFESLPGDLQRVVKEAAYEAAQVSLGINYQDDLTALEGLKSKGLIINTLTPAERAVFKKRLMPVYDKWKKKIGEDLYNEARAIIQGN
jgi:TRAP-type C4-dicarboxylate transport system substrate-binding protein